VTGRQLRQTTTSTSFDKFDKDVGIDLAEPFFYFFLFLFCIPWVASWSLLSLFGRDIACLRLRWTVSVESRRASSLSEPLSLGDLAILSRYSTAS
jgi:hypothetical protein